MSRQSALATAVTAALNAAPPGTFSQDFTARRTYVPRTTHQALQGQLLVSVIAAAIDLQRISRQGFQETLDVQVGVQAAINLSEDDDAVNAQVDPYTTLAEEIGEYLREQVISFDDFAVKPVTSVVDAPYATHELSQGLFTAVLRFRYRVLPEDPS
jgi:hypothetical protein